MQVSALELFFQPTQVNVLRYQRKKKGDNFPPGLYCVKTQALCQDLGIQWRESQTLSLTPDSNFTYVILFDSVPSDSAAALFF